MKVLIVDDHPESRTYLRRMLESHDCDVAEAGDGVEGVEKARICKPDVIISDALMPRMDGFQLLMQLKRDEATKDIPFIFYSGNYMGAQDVGLAMSLGAKAYILKPTQPQQLWLEINKSLQTEAEAGEINRQGSGYDDEQLRLYGKVVARKLDEKVHELQQEIIQRREAERRLQALSKSLLERLELERRHIARELHDDIGQILTVVKMNLQAALKMTDDGAISGLINDSIGSLEGAIKSVRNLSLNLRPSLLDDIGLSEALRWLIDRTAGPAGIRATFTASVFVERLPAEIETVCFRIAQEALNNIVKHAGATKISVELKGSDGRTELTITDNGSSFDVQEAFNRAVRGESFGLLGMQERAILAGGRLEIKSSPCEGTVLMAEFPYNGQY